MSMITCGELSLIVLAVRLHETLNMSPWLMELVPDLVHEGEVVSSRELSGLLISCNPSESKPVLSGNIFEEHHCFRILYIIKLLKLILTYSVYFSYSSLIWGFGVLG